MKNRLTQIGLIREYFQDHPNQDIPHPEVVDWATSEWTSRTGQVFRDPDRGIRKLYQEGYLIKVGKGVYRYDPNRASQREPEDFSTVQRAEILARDEYKCVMCGQGEREGMELHADHIKPQDRGGKATIENGQTLCSAHNFLKKNLKQTETGKKMFIRLLELARQENNPSIEEFCMDVLQTYENHDINGHIKWRKPLNRPSSDGD